MGLFILCTYNNTPPVLKNGLYGVPTPTILPVASRRPQFRLWKCRHSAKGRRTAVSSKSGNVGNGKTVALLWGQMNVNDLSNRRGKPSLLQIYREYSVCKFQAVYYDSLKSAGLFIFAVKNNNHFKRRICCTPRVHEFLS